MNEREGLSIAPGAGRQRITIHLHTSCACVVPRLPEVEQLTECHSQILTYQGGRSRWTDRVDPLWAISNAGEFVIPTGCVPRVARHLENLGYQVTTHDRRRPCSRKFQIDERMLAEMSAGQLAFANAMRSSRGGVIPTNSSVTMAEQTAVLARMFRPLRVLIPVATRAKQREITGLLAPKIGGALAASRKYCLRDDARVIVCTYEAFSLHNFEQFSIVIFPDAESACVHAVVSGLRPLDDHLIFGFVEHGKQLDRRTLLLLEAWIGPETYSPPSGWPTAPKLVTFCSVPQPPTAPQTDPLSWKRAAIWNNAQRNSQVAQLALAIRQGRSRTVPGLGWPANARVESDVADGRPVAVLVESVEHGRELTACLPCWPLLTRAEVDPRGEATIELERTLRTGGCIVTFEAYRKLRRLPASVVVRADASHAGMDISKLSVPTGMPHRHATLIVDLADEISKELQTRTEARVHEYLAAGFMLAGPTWITDIISHARTSDTVSISPSPRSNRRPVNDYCDTHDKP